MNDILTAFIQIMQVLSAPLTLLVAVLTLKGKGDDKTAVLTKMQVDIDYIKQNTSCIPSQNDRLVKVESSAASAHKRIDDHLKYDHQQKREEHQ